MSILYLYVVSFLYSIRKISMTKKAHVENGKILFFNAYLIRHAMQHKRRLLLHKFYFIRKSSLLVNTTQEVFNLMI